MRKLGMLVGLVALLACGGIMQEVHEEDIADLAVQVQALGTSPETTQVLDYLREVFVYVESGEIGFMAEAQFEVEIEAAIADGLITTSELTAIAARLPLPTTLPPVDRATREARFETMVVASGGRSTR